MEINRKFEILFYRKCSQRALWLCVLSVVLKVCFAWLVLTDLAGLLDCVTGMDRVVVAEYETDETMEALNTDKALNAITEVYGVQVPKAVTSAVKYAKHKGNRGLFSYYIYMYPLRLSGDILNLVDSCKDTMLSMKQRVESIASMSDVSEKEMCMQEVQQEREEIVEDVRVQVQSYADRYSLYRTNVFYYRVLSCLFFYLILFRISTGVFTKLEYTRLMKKVKWVL